MIRISLKEVVKQNNKLGSLITALRGGKSQTDLSKATGVPQSALSRAESGKVEIRLSSLYKMADKLGYDMELVFKEKETR